MLIFQFQQFQEQSYFIDAATDDFRLTDFNPCIGAGLSVLNMKPFDINGYDRPLPLGSFPDMGAYENPLALPITGCTDPMACNYNAAVLKGYQGRLFNGTQEKLDAFNEKYKLKQEKKKKTQIEIELHKEDQ